ncbi:MAG TPA: DUF1203 domain-containing protein [Bryobacteraceae bacterium]
MSFQISALPKSQFQHLFELPSGELASFRAVRMTADKKPGFPCRVSLADAEPGEEVILVHHEHQTADTPYRASHAVFVRQSANEAKLNVDETPEMLRSRLLSLRAFDEHGMLLTADVADGKVLETTIEEMFRDSSVAYIHIHFTKAGCYAARVDRA